MPEDPKEPEVKVENPLVDMVQVNSACFVLIAAMLITEAETMEITQHGFRQGEKVWGDYKVTVAKVQPEDAQPPEETPAP